MSNALAARQILTMNEATIGSVRELEQQSLGHLPQRKIPTLHVIHAGIYSRAIKIPAGITITGALIKISTQLILTGHFIVYIDNEPQEFKGHNILTGYPHRKQAGHAITDTYATMIFPTKARTVEEAEAEFTDEAVLLWSRYPDAENHIKITEE